MSWILVSLLLIASRVAPSSAQDLVPGGYTVIFAPSASGLSAQDTHLMAQDFVQNSVSSLGIESTQTTTYKIGPLSVLTLHDIPDSKVRALQTSASALGGTLSPNHVIRLNLPRAPVFPTSQFESAEPMCIPNCAPTCVSRSLISPGLHNLDWLDLHIGDATYCCPAPDTNKINVFVLDTGVEKTHPDLAAVSFAVEPTGNDCKQPGQLDWTPNTDFVGHGTHVTGTIASRKYGMTPNAIIHMIKVFDDTGSGEDANILCGLSKVSAWLDANPGKKCVVSMSLGYDTNVPSVNTVFSTFANTYASRAVVVVAAGNSAVLASTVTFASIPELLAVASTDPSLVESDFTNFGSSVKIFANGEHILSTYLGGTTARLSGTSMATPLVAAVCVEYFRNNPSATGSGLIATITGSASSDLHESGLITGLSADTPNKLIKYLCPGGCIVPNVCQNNPCLNGGVCTAFPNYYLCDCVFGYTGGRCETNINECRSHPCWYGGTCNDLLGSYSCTCPAGRTGTNCQIAGCPANQRTKDPLACDWYFLCLGGVQRRRQCPCVNHRRWLFDVNILNCADPSTAATWPNCVRPNIAC